MFLYFFLELIDHSPYWSELMHQNQTLFMDNSGEVHLRTKGHKLRSVRPVINQFQKETQNVLMEREKVDNTDSKI